MIRFILGLLLAMGAVESELSLISASLIALFGLILAGIGLLDAMDKRYL